MTDDFALQSGYNLTVDDVLALVDERLQNLGVQMQPGGDNPLPGYDPDYKTNSLRLPKDIPADESSNDGETQQPISAGETIHFDFVVHNQVDTDKAYGVIVKTPGAPTDGSFVITGPGKDRANLTIHGTKDDFNTPIGRFFSGIIHVRGTIEGGTGAGVVSIAYGEPEDQDDLPGGTGGVTVEDAEIITGTDSLHVDTAGVYEVTVTITVVQDTSSATVGGISGAGYIRNTPSSGPINDFPILQVNTPIIE